MLSVPISETYKKHAEKSVVDHIDYEILIAHSVIDPRSSDFEFESADTYAYPFSGYDLRRVVTTDKKPIQKQFVSFEHDFFKLGSSDMCFYEGTNKTLRQGFVSKAVCGSEGTFEGGNPKLIFQFASPIDMYGLTLHFDDMSGIYPSQFKVTADNGYDETFFLVDQTSLVIIPSESGNEAETFDRVSRLSIEFIQMNRPNVRARVSKLFFGVIQEFTDKDLTGSVSCSFDMDATMDSLPVQKMSFSLYDPDGKMDVENPKGIYKYLTGLQPVTAVLKAKYPLADTMLPGDETEETEFPLCDMMLTGQVERSGSSVTFNAQSYLQSASGKVDLRDLDDPNKDLTNMVIPETGAARPGMTLYAALEALLHQADIPLAGNEAPRWKLHDSLKSMSVKIPFKELDEKNINECIKWLVQAGRCVVYEDCYGVIHIEPRAEITVAEPEHYTFDTMFGIPQLNKIPALEKVVVQWNETDVESDRWNNPTGGEQQPIKNPAITDLLLDGLSAAQQQAKIKEIANHIAYELSLRNEYTTSIRGGAEMTPYDRILADTKYLAGQRAYLARKTLAYNGAVNSDITFYLEPEV